MNINIGDRVRDRVTDFEGLVTGHAEYLSGCDTYLVQPALKDGAWQEGRWFDEPRLTVVTVAAIAAVDTRAVRTGADGEAPVR